MSAPGRPVRLAPRRLVKSRPGRWLVGTSAGRWALTQRRHAAARAEARREPARFTDLHTCCLFLGHVKSGGSLLGAMIDAHPAAAIADEIDVAAQVAAGLTRDEVFHLLVRGARREAGNGRVTARRLEPYSLAVEGQWQGRHARLQVVGDSRGGPTTRVLGDDPQALTGLRAALAPVRVAFVHVVRNPHEPISAMVRRSGRPLAAAVADHRAQCHRLLDLRGRIPPGDLHTVRYERLVADPRRELSGVFAFLGLPLHPDVLTACAALLRPEPVRDRDRIEWPAEAREAVAATIADVDFLAGYGFER
ncbi:sulfotransferase [Egicoccus sp. AB-alg2]|uniref:sulfotransferase family protein n=1 Tax=Egicoccus sp. AB-alg2 TaxID=3242693 RepID=UPI00359ED0D6